MKVIHSSHSSFAMIAVLGMAGMAAMTVKAQVITETREVSTSTTTTQGVIHELSPETLIIQSSEANSAPIRYRFTESTQYVDEAGQVVSVEVVKSGLPVTVYSESVGDQLVASKVVVKKSGSMVAPVTRTAPVATAVSSPVGTITELGPDSVVIRTESGPIRYAFTEKTQYVDVDGHVVSREVIKSGVPITVDYLEEGARLVARKVIVHTHQKAPPAEVIEKTTTTTTTVEQP